jgi:phage gp36-like protein
MAYSDPDSAALQKLETDATKRASAVDAADSLIDNALASSPLGYVVPVDVTAISDATVKARVTALLDELSTSLAAWHLTRGHAGAPQKVKKDWEKARNFLDQIAKGRAEFSGVPRSSATGTRIGVVGDQGPDFPQSLYDCADRMLQ